MQVPKISGFTTRDWRRPNELIPSAFWASWSRARFEILVVPPGTSVSVENIPSRSIPSETTITAFPGEPYDVTKPIPVILQMVIGEVQARFEAANIAMTGSDEADAIENLANNLLDVFEKYSANETRLGPEPARQLHVLREHIVGRPRH